MCLPANLDCAQKTVQLLNPGNGITDQHLNTMKKSIILLMCMLTVGRLSAQNVSSVAKMAANQITSTVTGIVKDTTGATIPGTVVKLTSDKDNLLTATNANGQFTFSQVKSATFVLTFTSIGYRSLVKKIANNKAVKMVSLGTIVLKEEQHFLKEVAINGAPAVIYKTDKTEYKASAYKVRQSTTTNDLLRNMPGIQVNANGTITHQGQQVTKIRLNGKDYIGGDAKQAIRNLPADIIEKAQRIDDYGDQASRAGIKGYIDVNDEAYATLIENKYQNPKDNPLSTFSVDVDNASYSNIRRFINGGHLPPADAVRIEEMINYFKYQLPEPKDDGPVAIVTELAAAPWNPNHRLLRIGLKARTIPTDKLPASNLVFLIDVSGSMNEENKLPLVKTSMKMLVEQLRPQDKVAIVVYAGNAGLVLPATAGDQKEKINTAIDNLSAGGSTAGGAGIMLAYKVARENFKKGGNNRIVLATDGDFNVGASSDESMEQLITKERESGVDLSIMGFGMGNYKDSKMETLADKGNGNYAYIDNITEAHKALVSEFGGTMFTVAKDVKLQIEFNPAKVQAYRLIGYENRILAKEDFNNDKKDAGDMGSGHTVTAFYEIVPAGIKDDYAGSVDPLKYQKVDKTPAGSVYDEMLAVKFRYKEPQGSVSKMSEFVVKDTPRDFDKLSADYRFAAAVAEIGMLLRQSDYKGKATYQQAIAIAKAAKGNDEEGYRSEFVRLAESARLMVKGEALAAGK
jgi:Ca-activated chloride channel family protein